MGEFLVEIKIHEELLKSSHKWADIGIMPLEDNLWARGKCSYKMLTYMACGLPVVVSPVGMNKEVLDIAAIGMAAERQTQWADALLHLLNTPDEAREMGIRGRQNVLQFYTVEIIGNQLAGIVRAFV